MAWSSSELALGSGQMSAMARKGRTVGAGARSCWGLSEDDKAKAEESEA